MANGLSKGMSLQDIASKHKVDLNTIKQELKKGVKVEMEHTSDPKKAARIAMDHLVEDPKYYSKLATLGLEEVGEASAQTYPFDFDGQFKDIEDINYIFSFETDSGYFYEVTFEQVDDNVADVSFGATKDKLAPRASNIITNEGELYKVMATVIAISKEFIRMYPQYTTIIYKPNKKEGESKFLNKRDRIYRLFIQKSFPEAKISVKGDNVYVERPVNEVIDRSNKLKISIYPNQQGVDIDDPEEYLKTLSPLEIPLSQLRLNEPASKMKQPESRKQLKKFIDKIRRGMNINPIVVRKLDDKYQILDGHHRFFAHKALGLDKIKAVVVEPRFIEILGEGRKKRKKVNYYWPAFFGDGSAEAADGGGDGGGLEEAANTDNMLTVISVIDGKRNLPNNQIFRLFKDNIGGTFYIYSVEEGEYEDLKPISRQEAYKYIDYYNARIDGDWDKADKLAIELGIVGIESELHFNKGEFKTDPSVFSKNENYANGNNLNENLNRDLVKEFMKHIKNELDLNKFPKIELSNDSQEAIDLRSWGGYQPANKSIHIVVAKRHPADIFRTLAHELVHYKQDLEGRLKPGSGMTGSEDENEANSRAAVIMRNFAQAKPNLFEHLNK
jgi:hypothetical protein